MVFASWDHLINFLVRGWSWNRSAIPVDLKIRIAGGTTRKFLDSMGPGLPIAASFAEWHKICLLILVRRAGVAGHLASLPATAASLAFAGRGSRLLLSAVVDNGDLRLSLFAYRLCDSNQWC